MFRHCSLVGEFFLYTEETSIRFRPVLVLIDSIIFQNIDYLNTYKLMYLINDNYYIIMSINHTKTNAYDSSDSNDNNNLSNDSSSECDSIENSFMSQKISKLDTFTKASVSNFAPFTKLDTDAFVNGSRRDRMKLIKSLLVSKDLNTCSKCSLWFDSKGEKLLLQINHINGHNNDNRIENLRYVCQMCQMGFID